MPFWTKLLSSLGSALSRLKNGRNWTSVSAHCYVIRLAEPPKDYLEKRSVLGVQLFNEKLFQPSSDDKKSVPPYLSVWADYLTTPKQAYNFLLENKPDSPLKLVLRLSVSEICKIEGYCGTEVAYTNLLQVVWAYLFCEAGGKRIRDSRLGAKGHAGITGWDEGSTPQGLTARQAKNLRKDLRSRLADLASKNHHLLDI